MEREEIIKASADFVVDKVEASLDEVAHGIGITPEEMRGHFPDRYALIWALGKMGTDLMEESLAKARIDEGPALDAVRRLIGEAWGYASFLAFLYGENPLHGPGELDDAFVRIGDRGTEMFARGQREGAFRTDLPAAWMSEAMWVLIAVASWEITKGHLEPEQGQEGILAMLLDGARVPATA